MAYNVVVTSDAEQDLDKFIRYDKVVGSIKLALQRGLPTTVRMNVSPENIDECLEEKKYIENQNWGNDHLWFDLQPVFQASHIEHGQLYASLFCNDVDAKKRI